MPQVVDDGAGLLVGLLEGVDQRPALDRDAAAHGVDPGVGAVSRGVIGRSRTTVSPAANPPARRAYARAPVGDGRAASSVAPSAQAGTRSARVTLAVGRLLDVQLDAARPSGVAGLHAQATACRRPAARSPCRCAYWCSCRLGRRRCWPGSRRAATACA